jgi:multidrug efflux pump subunit AcrB
MRVLAYVIDRRWIIVVASLATLGSCFPLVKAVPKGFLPKNDEAQFEINLRTPEGTSLAATQIAAERIAREVREWPEVETTLLSIGDNQQRTPNLASIFVRLLPPDKRRLSQDELQEKVRREIIPKQPKDYRMTASAVAAFGGGTFSTATVQYILSGPDLNQLTKYTAEIVDKLKGIPQPGDR